MEKNLSYVISIDIPSEQQMHYGQIGQQNEALQDKNVIVNPTHRVISLWAKTGEIWDAILSYKLIQIAEQPRGRPGLTRQQSGLGQAAQRARLVAPWQISL